MLKISLTAFKYCCIYLLNIEANWEVKKTQSLKMKFNFFCVLFILISKLATANHIFGGYIGFKTIDPGKGKYKFSLKFYIDVPASEPGFDVQLRYDPVNLIIYKKRDNSLMERVGVVYRKKTEIVFKNVACALTQNFEILVYEFDYDDVYLDPEKYTDPMGYYVVYDKCCRNYKIENIQNAGDGSILFYTEFPPLKENGELLNYSTPNFPILNGDYICKNKTFDYSVVATDDDNDELKYKIVAPYRGDNTIFSGNDAKPGPYSDVIWKAPYSSNNPLGGQIPLKINSETGLITLKTSNKGLFLFSFAVEDYRNGKKMGLVRHDFQLPVVDCNLTPLPPPEIKYLGTIVPDLSICNGDQAELEATLEPSYNYQWQRDGINIENETTKSLVVKEPGTYQIVKSLKSVCSNDTSSNTIIVVLNSIQPKIIASGPTLCNNQKVILKVNAPIGYSLSWVQNNLEIGKADSIEITNPGKYFIIANKANSNCKAEKDSISIGYSQIDALPLPKASYFACEGESLKLQTIDKPNFTYLWTLNDTLINSTTNNITVVKNGNYIVSVVDEKGCTAKSLPYNVEFVNPLTLKFDSLNTICASEYNKINLFATPSGGQFSGPGVTDKVFDPSIAGVGNHNITYSISFSPTCIAEIKRSIEVVSVFDIVFSPNNIILLDEKDSVVISAITNESNLAAHWHPDDFLGDHHALNQTIKPNKDIVYNVVVINSNGCKVIKEIKITIIKALKELVYFPNAFSPNGDGINDTFEIISKVDSLLEFKVFDRWGAEVYNEISKKPSWNGLINNNLSKNFNSSVYNGHLRFLGNKDFIRFAIYVLY
jgi:gliding motility-associated-like protein